MARISKRLVDSAQPKAKRQIIWDDSVSGFGLMIQPTGVRSYCFQYRTPEGRTRRLVLGKHGTLTPDMARDRAEECRRKVEQGQDPAQEKRERRAALSVAQLLDKYLASGKFAEKAETTRAIDRGRIQHHLKPIFGRKIADKVSSEDIRKGFAAIRDGKTAATIKTGRRGLARVQGGEGAARMAIRLLKAVYNWGIESKLLKENPAAGVDVGRDNERTAIIESMEQYSAIFATITTLENTAQVRRPAADAIRVIMLTGARRGEIAGLRNRHLNLKKGIATLDRKEHKTGRKTSKPRIIELPPAALEIIARQPAGKPDDYVFQPAYGEGPLSLNKPWRLIRETAGVGHEIVLHTMRHSLATLMAMTGHQAPDIAAILGHRDIKTSQKYIHLAEQHKKKLAERASAGISAALTGAASGKIVEISKQK
jgi:integrase